MNKLRQKQKLRQNLIGIVLGMFLMGIIMTSINNLQADSINAGVYSLDERPTG
jgi:hypothetical protein